jgi:hypothetical protein
VTPARSARPCIRSRGRDHPGEPVLVGQLLGTKDVWAVHTIIEALRRVGHLIEGAKGQPGYTYRGFVAPPRWLHLENVLRDVVRESLRSEDEVPGFGQMELLDRGEA